MGVVKTTISVTAGDAQKVLDNAIGAVDGILDKAEKVLVQEGARMADTIRKREFIFTEDFESSLAKPLIVRSGKLIGSVGSKVTERSESAVAVTVGGINASDDVLAYFETQEIGRTIGAKNPSGKLAFPPSDAGSPLREHGVQQMWMGQFMDDHLAYGYTFVKVTDNALLGKQTRDSEFELLFIRKESVTIPPRHMVTKHVPDTQKRINEGLDKLLEAE